MVEFLDVKNSTNEEARGEGEGVTLSPNFVQMYQSMCGRVLSVTWTSRLFAGTRTTLALMPDWDTLDYGIQHQVPDH